jgi:hypothetical protein
LIIDDTSEGYNAPQERSMIVACLRGGLGNQMFQYAAARCLAVRNGDQIVLEGRGLHETPATPRRYELDLFGVTAPLITLEEVTRDHDVVVTVIERRRGYHPEVMEMPSRGCLVLAGLWLSERYFKPIEPLVRADFRFPDRPPTATERAIRGAASVAVHVRRGDYLLPFSRHFTTLDVDYYQRAIAFIARQVQDPHFFVFSDDLPWCRAHLAIELPHTFVHDEQGNPHSGAEDLRLMSLCRHFVIANSTFSWWGAWLGAHPDKRVVAPESWYRDDPARARSKDLIPAEWTLL